jgi:hypothetical protein
MRINSDGNVGINTDEPTNTLEIAGTVSGSSTLQAVGATVLGNTLAVSGTVTVAGDIDHAGDPDTYLRFATNTVNLVAGGKSAIKLDTSTEKIQLNNSNEDLDVQIMADDGEVILHADAGTNKLGINTDSPSDALTVAGGISGSSTLQAVGNTFLGAALNVSGAVTLSDDAAATSISGSGTLQMVGNTFLGAALNVSGAATLAGGLNFDLTSDASGDMYYRDGSGDLTRIAVGSDNHVLTLNGAVPGWEAAAGGGGSPGGSDTQVQFNDSDSFGGDSGLTFNKTSNVLTVGGLSNAGSTVIDRVSKASGDSPYTMTADDHYIGLDTSGGAIQVDLQAAAAAVEGRVIIIKDETGDAGTNNITVAADTVGSETIDGSTTQVINNAYGSLTLVCTNRGGKQWAIV